MSQDVGISFKSYDRFIPNQDYLPTGGFGNLIALPLQGKARKSGNSVFVDEQFQPYSDQWEYLQSIRKLSENMLDVIVRKYGSTQPMGELSTTSESKPWEVPAAPQISPSDFAATISIVKANMLFIPTKGVSAKILNHFKRIASFKNPEFYSHQAMRFSTYSIPRIISCADRLLGDSSRMRRCRPRLPSRKRSKGEMD